jgi:hypothetical protein
VYPNGRSEDGIISYGWKKFIDQSNAGAHSGDSEWMLRLPMARAVSRAMDTVTYGDVVRHSKHSLTADGPAGDGVMVATPCKP